VRKSVCFRLLKIDYKVFPLLKEGGEVDVLDLVDGMVFVVGEQVDDGVGISFLKGAGRDVA